jgi:hypothetical protein
MCLQPLIRTSESAFRPLPPSFYSFCHCLGYLSAFSFYYTLKFYCICLYRHVIHFQLPDSSLLIKCQEYTYKTLCLCSPRLLTHGIVRWTVLAKHGPEFETGWNPSLRVHWKRVEIRGYSQVQETVLFFITFRLVLGPTQSLIQPIQWAFSPREKRSEHKSDLPHLRLKMSGAITPLLNTTSCVHRENFTSKKPKIIRLAHGQCLWVKTTLGQSVRTFTH